MRLIYSKDIMILSLLRMISSKTIMIFFLLRLIFSFRPLIFLLWRQLFPEKIIVLRALRLISFEKIRIDPQKNRGYSLQAKLQDTPTTKSRSILLLRSSQSFGHSQSAEDYYRETKLACIYPAFYRYYRLCNRAGRQFA